MMMLMTEEEAVRLQQIQFRIALNKRLTKRCGKRFRVHQRKDFEPDCSRSTRVRRKTWLGSHIRSDSVSDLY